LATLLVLAVAGCERSDGLQTYPVRGTVTLDGTPVNFGGVRFVSDSGRLATGEIQSDGSYSMQNPKWGPGVPAGNYQVSVQVRELKEETKTRPAWPGPSLIPEKYEDPATSGLTFEVVPGDNRFNIELSSTP